MGARAQDALRDSLSVDPAVLPHRCLQPKRQYGGNRDHGRFRHLRILYAQGRFRRGAVHPRVGSRADHGNLAAPVVADLARKLQYFSYAADLRSFDRAHRSVFDLAAAAKTKGRRQALDES